MIGWDGTEETEAKIKEETGFTTRNIPFNPPVEKTVEHRYVETAEHTVWIARAILFEEVRQQNHFLYK